MIKQYIALFITYFKSQYALIVMSSIQLLGLIIHKSILIQKCFINLEIKLIFHIYTNNLCNSRYIFETFTFSLSYLKFYLLTILNKKERDGLLVEDCLFPYHSSLFEIRYEMVHPILQFYLETKHFTQFK